MAGNTVFDSAFKAMARKAPQLTIPFINETKAAPRMARA